MDDLVEQQARESLRQQARASRELANTIMRAVEVGDCDRLSELGSYDDSGERLDARLSADRREAEHHHRRRYEARSASGLARSKTHGALNREAAPRCAAS